MSISSIVMLIIICLILYGGLGVCLSIAMRRQ
ncbi:MetS family NSS transporter small subunit [Calorimonas adulescens]|uniref:MetS family NSS transporter small subunit n=1 Tax=Calorimonas adulescens TaxID=2606906 RepID=A0A5D8QH36_9THEO|nr:MetS family NSS transporter small subunit [Calorimonas adulescens]